MRFSEDGNLYSDHVLTSLVLSWAPLEMDWFKVNINRVIRRARMEAACGGVVGDHHGKFLIGFQTGLGMKFFLY